MFIIPVWLFRGIAFVKQRLAEIAQIDVSVLPYNLELLDWLRQENASGRDIVLCTGSNGIYAKQVFDFLGLFSAYYASDIDTNLTGRKKAALLKELYTDRSFSYVGNEHKDLNVWKHAESAVIVTESAETHLAKQAAKLCTVEKCFPAFEEAPKPLKTLLKAMRVHQWSKNALLFVPLLTAHQVFHLPSVLATCLAFLSFGLVASATYLINDLSDLDSDRNHWKKQKRPLAAATLSIKHGFMLCAVLFVLSFAITFALPSQYLFVLLAYVVITLGYSFYFKRLQTVDLVVLASLYTVRLFAGSAAIGVLPSFWLLVFSMFIFLCLAIVKRISEIKKKLDQDPNADRLSGRGYYVSDLPVLSSLSCSSGMVAILVFAMYVNSPEVIELYKAPMVLWAVCPIIGYWITRVLIMTSRGEIDEDPISFAIKDARSWAAGACALITVLIAWLVSF